MTIRELLFSILAIVLFPQILLAQIQLPELISDGVVLQRNEEVKIWGEAVEDEEVTLRFRDSTFKATANEKGIWEATFPKMSAGGPYTMTITTADTSIKIKNIMIGDVWISSGQSNMELSMERVRPLYESEIANAENDAIRYFDVPEKYDFNHPQTDLESGNWRSSNPDNVLEFSAVAYFFAKKLNKEYDVPVGIINASVGGSPVESWISEGSLKDEFPDHFDEALRFRDSTLTDSIRRADQQRANKWYSELNRKDRGYKQNSPWYDPEIDDSNWATMDIPGYWADEELGDTNGVVWFRKEITVPQEMNEKGAKLLLGRVVDSDSVFVNGEFVGTTGYQYPPRRYEIPSDILKEGENEIAVRVINSGGRGGFIPDKPYKLIGEDQEIDLKGSWKYKLGAEADPLAPQTFIRWKPLGLYNGMIAPLQDFKIRGVIWYQGESNTDNPVEYQKLFSKMIEDWRKGWERSDLPFLYVQLANYMEDKDQPSQSNWAMLREAQRKTLSLPNTGMAVAIDVGEWNDIHPLKKKEVGDRLALAAQKISYNEDEIVYSGPSYKAMEIEDQMVKLTFENTGNGLTAKDSDKLHGFAVAGSDCNFVWAEAEINGDTVFVSSDEVSNPKVARYAWSDNPKRANLYNKEGLPASPFSTGGLKKCTDQ